MLLPIIILILISFLQATFLPLNLVLIFLICRSFIVEDNTNYWLAFGFGLLLSLLLGFPLGSLSFIYLVGIFMVYLAKRTHFASHWLVIVPLALGIIVFDQVLENLALGFNLNFKSIIIQIILVLPAYFMILFWEERFIARKDIRLKIGK